MVEPIRYDICYMINIHSPLISFYSGHIMRLSGIESTEWKMTIYWSMMKVSILQNPYDSANSVNNVYLECLSYRCLFREAIMRSTETGDEGSSIGLFSITKYE